MEFRAEILDDNGRSAWLTFNAASETDAKVIANDIGAKSNGKWVSLFSYEAQDIDPEAGVYANLGQTAVAGANAQARAILTFNTLKPRSKVRVDLPGPLSSYVNPTGFETTTEPTTEAVYQLLQTPHGMASTTFRKARYDEHVRTVG